MISPHETGKWLVSMALALTGTHLCRRGTTLLCVQQQLTAAFKTTANVAIKNKELRTVGYTHEVLCFCGCCIFVVVVVVWLVGFVVVVVVFVVVAVVLLICLFYSVLFCLFISGLVWRLWCLFFQLYLKRIFCLPFFISLLVITVNAEVASITVNRFADAVSTG